MKLDYLSGSKGGGGGGSTPPPPTNTPDNLRSNDTIECILAIGEGPMFGLEDGAKSFRVGDTQLQNENGEYNFPTFKLTFFSGEEEADPVIPVLGGSASNTAVNVNLASNVSVTRQTQSGQINFVDVRIAFNRLLESTQNGTFNATVNFRIEYKPLSALTWTKAFGSDISINGKTTSVYVKEIRIELTPIDEPYEIRVTKLSPDNSTDYFADMTFESFQEIISGTKAYNNTAIIQLVGEASDQFSSIPSWSGIYKGLLVRIPSNYDPITRIYTGIWDGTFNVAWTDNPAWCTYDFIMNDRYGIKSYYSDINLDKYDVYEAAQWCDELVPDGKGGTQPRYTFNALISEPRSGKELARYMAGSFNATFFDDLNGRAYLRVDKDEDACHIFTPENIIDGTFEYSYTDITSRFNEITVTFRNPDLNWEEDRRLIKDDEYIAKNGRIPLDFIAVGCINAHEARRRAMHKLITANTETCLVRFRTNRIGQFVNPFDVMLICDPDMGYGVSGRVKDINPDRASITLRTPIYLEAGVSYDIQFILSNGDIHRTNLVETTKGYNTELKFTAPLPEGLVPDRTVFTLEHPTLIGLPRPFRVTKVEENDGNADSFIIEGININRNKWNDADNLTQSDEIDYSSLPDPFDPPGPTSVSFEERYIKNKKEFQITVSPVFDRGAYKYYKNDHSFQVWSRPKGTDQEYVRREVLYGDTLINHPAGLYQFKVLGVSYLGNVSRIETAPVYEFNVTNPKDAPKNVDWVRRNKREIYWGYLDPPDDFAGFIVRYHNQDQRTTWFDAIQPHTGILTATTFYTSLIPPSARTIMVRAVDDFGIVSEESAVIYMALGDVSATNVVDRFDYHEGSPAWAGVLEGCSVDGGSLKADDTGGLMYSGVPTAFMYDGGDMYESTYQEMFYYDYFTVTSAGSMVIQIDFEGAGYEVSIREDISGDQPWTPVAETQFLEPGEYEIRLRVFGGKVRGVVNEFSVIIDADDISEDIQDLIVPSDGIVRLPITKDYSVIKIVNVIIQDDGTDAVSYRIMDKDVNLGPQIILLDPTGAGVGGLIDAQIKGY